MAPKLADYKTNVHNDWCPGCGDFGILNAIQMSLAEMNIPQHKAAIFSGIGCSGKTAHYINVSGIHTLHGRVLPFAQGAAIANPDMRIIAVGGDGDGLGIGAGHFVAAGRRNVNMAYIIFDNGVYGLTKGQASPTLHLGTKTKSLAVPNVNYNVNPIGLAVTSGFTFVARGYSYEVAHLKDILKAAIDHKGLAFVDVLSPCPTYNNVNTRDWYANKNPDSAERHARIYKLEDEPDFDPVIHFADPKEINQKLSQAITRSLEWNDRIPIGVFYKNETVTPFSGRIMDQIPNYFENPPASQDIANGHDPASDISEFVKELEV